MNLQPLRIEAGWKITYNQLYEVDPIAGYEHYFEGSSLLVLHNEARLTIIDVTWQPEGNLNGAFKLLAINYLENFDARNNQFNIHPNWETPIIEFSTSSRIKLVAKLEELMLVLPVYKDPRILKNRGVVDDVSESYRLALLTNGITPEIVTKIIENGNTQIQSLLLDHANITREIITTFAENGATKKVKNKAISKLTNKKFS